MNAKASSSFIPHASSFRSFWQTWLLLVAILLLGAHFRFQNLYGWDGVNSRSGQHPDERFIVYTAYGLQVPRSFGEYLRSSCLVNGQVPHPRAIVDLANRPLDPSTYEPGLDSGCNTLNPRNYGWSSMFVYGSLPTTLARITAELRYGGEGTQITPIQIRDVGRTQSMFFDLGSILLVFLIGRKLYGSGAGLLAALLYACAALPIQLSHFFTVDAATGFFTLLSLYWAVRIARGAGIFSFIMLGISVGGAMACRITMATLGMTAVLAVLQRLWEQRQLEGSRQLPRSGFMLNLPWAFLLKMSALLIVSGLMALLSFRLLAPDTFVGTSFFDIRPEPRFLDNILKASGYVSGSIDAPFSQQWASRTPFLFPLSNMVVWGMGLALGLTAWLAWAVAAWQIVRRRVLRNLIPVTWIGFYFAWQGGQFGMTMRYYALLYGLFAVLAAWGLLALRDYLQTKPVSVAATSAHEAAGQKSMAAWLVRLDIRPALGHWRWLAWLPVAVVALGTLLWAQAFTAIYRQPHTRIAASQWMYENVPTSAIISAEEWDDPLPMELEGHNPGIYLLIKTQPYMEDDLIKYTGYVAQDGTQVEGLLDQLGQIDYLILASNRVYDSATRLPMRYPALTRYYHYLFNGELGFELVADFHSYPTLFGLSFPDQGAEEAFSVYDHPRVLIFKRTAAFSRDKAEQLLTSDVAFGEVYKIPTVDVKKVPTALRLTDVQWQRYRDGGTWTTLFNEQGLASRVPALFWLLALELLGMAAFVLLFPALAMLPDRGFALSKLMGLLLVSYAAWLLASLRVLTFAPNMVWACVGALLLGSLLSAWFGRRALRHFVRTHWHTLLFVEALFLLSYAGMLLLRSLNPDLWLAAGSNRLTELATLTAVVKSASFPPYDPWFAGGYLNIPYFGFVLVSVLMQLTGIVPGIAYNLGLASMFALAVVGAWGVAYNLVGSATHSLTRSRSRLESIHNRRALLSGLIAAGCVMLAGPLGSHFALPYAFGFYMFGVLGAASLSFPLHMAALALLVAVLRANIARSWRQSIVPLGLLALSIGALRASSRWDVLPLLALIGLSLLLAGWARRGRQSLRAIMLQLLLVWLLSTLLFLPFTRAYASELGRLGFSLDQRSTSQDIMASIGVWLFVLISAGMLIYRRAMRLGSRALFIIFVLAGLAILASVALNVTAFIPIGLLLVGAGLLLGDLLMRPLADSMPEERIEVGPLTSIVMLWVVVAMAMLLVSDFIAFKGVNAAIGILDVYGPLCWSIFAISAGLALPWLWVKLGHTHGALRWAWRIPAVLLCLATLSALVLGLPDHLAARSQAAGGLSLDGSASARQGSWKVNDQDIALQDDTRLVDWIRKNISGTPILLEGNQDDNPWSGRIAALTGLPTLIAQPARASEQRAVAYAQVVIDYRRELVSWIYSSGNQSEVLRHLKLYGIEYVYVGDMERALYPETGLQLFDQLVASHAASLVHTEGNAKLYHIPADNKPPALLTTTLPVHAPANTAPPTQSALLPQGQVDTLPSVGLLGQLGRGGASAQILAVVLWLLLGYGAMLLGLPIAVFCLGAGRRWSDAGYAWARLIGLLLLGYAVWLPVSATWWYYDWRGAMLGLGLVIVLDGLLLAGIGYRGQTEAAGPLRSLRGGLRELGSRLRQHTGRIIQVEVLFLLSFGFMLLLRAMNPDLWQPYWGGEKPFEFGLLNAILRSPVMPPYSPFFSDGTINYYYYGIFLVSLPIKLAGIAPAIGFNLVIASLYALFCSQLFALAARISGRAWVGLAAVILVAFFGNLAAFFAAGWSEGIGPALIALQQGPAAFGPALGSWFVGPSRVIPNTINEFPFWGFLFADLHPHLIAMPITLLAIALAYSMAEARSGRVGEWESGRVGEWESGRVGEWESGRVGEWESGRVGEWESGRVGEWESGTGEGWERQETGDTRHETRDTRHETAVGSGTGEERERQETGDRRQETRDTRQETRDTRHETAVGSGTGEVWETGISSEKGAIGTVQSSKQDHSTFNIQHSTLVAAPLLLSLTLGTLAVTNSWDLPTYALLLLGVLLAGGWRMPGSLLRRLVHMLGGAMTAASIALLGIVLFTPFFLHFQSPVGGLGLVTTPTKLRDYVMVYGIFLAILLPVVIGASWRVLRQAAGSQVQAETSTGAEQSSENREDEQHATAPDATTLLQPDPQQTPTPSPPYRSSLSRLFQALLLILAAGLLVGVVMALSAPVLAAGTQPTRGLPALAEQIQALFGPRIWAAVLLLCALPVLFSRRVSMSVWFATWLAVLGLAVSVGIEVIYVRDHLKDGEWYRMNTVFKFGEQIWILLGLAAALALPRLIRTLNQSSLLISIPAGMLLLVLAALGLLYPLVGVPSRVAYRFPDRPGPTLDGLAFLDQAIYPIFPSFLGLPDGSFEPIPIALKYDADAIGWLNDTIDGTPVVLQSSAEFYRLYGVRIAANTGLPTIVSPLHEAEQHNPRLVWERDADVQQIYRTREPDLALRLMAKYQVAYVVVGPIERIIYGDVGTQKFQAMTLPSAGLQPSMQIAYQNEQVTIYAVNPAAYQRLESAAAQELSANTQTRPPPHANAEITALEQQLKADPANAELIWKLAQAYADAGRPEDGAQVLAPLAQSKPDDVLIQHVYGDMLADAGNFEAAEAAYRHALDVEPSAGNMVKLAQGLIRFGKIDAAEEVLAQATSIDPNLASAQCALGQIAETRARVDQARGFYQRCLELARPGEAARQEAEQALERLK